MTPIITAIHNPEMPISLSTSLLPSDMLKLLDVFFRQSLNFRNKKIQQVQYLIDYVGTMYKQNAREM